MAVIIIILKYHSFAVHTLHNKSISTCTACLGVTGPASLHPQPCRSAPPTVTELLLLLQTVGNVCLEGLKEEKESIVSRTSSYN